MPEPLNVDVLAGGFLNTSTCLEWFLYDFSEGATQDTIDFIGYNSGKPMTRPEWKGLFGEMLTNACFEYDT